MSGSFPSLSQSGGRAFPLPTIAEDTLHYVLHLPPSSSDDSASSATATALLITQYVHDLLPNPWIWNRDSWELKVQPNSSGTVLEGTIRVGDAVDDEWLVVWLLRKISKKWTDLIIGIRDSDGEFLLIEAANELPSWVSPENAQNRLWLQDAHLHLIPLNIRSSTAHARQIPKDEDEDEERGYDPEAWLSENDALRAVRSGKYRAESRMEQAVWDRIACYPNALKTHQHRTKAYLPIPIAKALSENPELIQRAVEGFYVRDPAQLRAASRMTHFPPSSSILSSVTMTRAAYAQLQGQVFHPPRVFGPEWHVRQEEGESSPGIEKERRWRDLGVKISTGFEIMYREGGKKGRSGENLNEDDNLVKSAEYKTFLETLKRAGYFGKEVAGSAKWNERELQAKKEYQVIKAIDTASQRPSFAYLVDSAIASSSSTSESLVVSPSAEEDTEEWLEVSPDELDNILQRAAASTSGRPGAIISESLENGHAEIGAEHGQALHDLAKQVEEFVGGQGDVEGARFEDELSDDDMNDDDDDDNDDEDDEVKERQVLEAGRQERLDNLVPALPESEWGQKSVPTVAAEVETASDNINIDKGSRMEMREKKVGFEDTDMLPASMRPPRFTKEHYDGVESNSEDEDIPDEADLPPAGTLGRKIALMKWGDGEDKSATVEELNEDDDEEEEDRKRKADLTLDDDIDIDGEDDEMQRRIWEDEEDQPMVEGMEMVDVDMLDEQEEFLKFSREALGISDDMWQGILGDRRARGAFVPEVSSKAKLKSDTKDISNTKTKGSKGIKNVNFAQSSSANTTSTPSAPPTTAPANSGSIPPPPPEVVGKNASLDSFENVMRAMDAELARVKGGSGSSKPNTKSAHVKESQTQATSSTLKSGKGTSATTALPKLPTEAELEEMDDSDLEAMDEELRKALKSAGIDDIDEDDQDEGNGAGELEGDQKREYEMMRDFLQSYQSQAGTSGVVGNLFGRLGSKE